LSPSFSYDPNPGRAAIVRRCERLSCRRCRRFTPDKRARRRLRISARVGGGDPAESCETTPCPSRQSLRNLFHFAKPESETDPTRKRFQREAFPPSFVASFSDLSRNGRASSAEDARTSVVASVASTPRHARGDWRIHLRVAANPAESCDTSCRREQSLP